MYIALKMARDKEDKDGYDDDGRYFAYYDETSVKDLYDESQIEEIFSLPSGTNENGGRQFLNLILRRVEPTV
jgi:hypothetical protein